MGLGFVISLTTSLLSAAVITSSLSFVESFVVIESFEVSGVGGVGVVVDEDFSDDWVLLDEDTDVDDFLLLLLIL